MFSRVVCNEVLPPSSNSNVCAVSGPVWFEGNIVATSQALTGSVCGMPPVSSATRALIRATRDSMATEGHQVSDLPTARKTSWVEFRYVLSSPLSSPSSV